MIARAIRDWSNQVGGAPGVLGREREQAPAAADFVIIVKWPRRFVIAAGVGSVTVT